MAVNDLQVGDKLFLYMFEDKAAQNPEELAVDSPIGKIKR